MVGFEIGIAERFFALPPAARLERILDATFADWCVNLNHGVSLVYDNACAMIHGVTSGIFAAEDKPGEGPFAIFSSRLGLPIDLGLDNFNPDAGALSLPDANGKQRFLLMLQTAVRSLSTDDAPLEPRYLLPQEPAIFDALAEAYEQIFAVQFRFWAKDLADESARYQAFRASLADHPEVVCVEKDFSAMLRVKHRFRIKRKEPLETFETAVRGIAIGRDIQGA